MKKETQQKLHDMMYSEDKEMSRLGISMLKGELMSYKHFRNLRGLSMKGKSFFPYKLKNEVGLLAREMRTNNKLNSKKWKRQNRVGNAKNYRPTSNKNSEHVEQL